MVSYSHVGCPCLPISPHLSPYLPPVRTHVFQPALEGTRTPPHHPAPLLFAVLALALRVDGARPSSHPDLGVSTLQDGTDVLASNLSLLNGTHALAVQPPFGWLTYYAVADVLLSDSLGRTAYIFAGYTIAPDPLQYAATAALVVLLVALSCALPAYLRAGCAAEMRRPRHAAKALRGAAATAAAGQGGASSQRSAGGGSSALV